MSEVQKHGFTFEAWVKKVLGVDKLATKYTQKWDVMGEKPTSVKFMGLKNALEFSSAVRLWEVKDEFNLVVGRWEQVGHTKIIRSIDEIKITPEILKKLKGNISLDELKAFDVCIKKFPSGKKGQMEGSNFAKRWKQSRKKQMGLLTITYKIDSKKQRRVQCNLNYVRYVGLFGKSSMTPVFRGQLFSQHINHASRKFNKE